MMYTNPSPRWKYYQPSNFQKIQDDVTALTNELSTALGFYFPRASMSLLKTMKLTSAASLILGLLFGIIIILFVVISILLIYSLLMISVETKTFENGVLRLLGMSKSNCISMIIIQSLMFVIPSIVCGYVLALPALAGIFSAIFKNNSDIEVTCIPSASATI